VPENEQWRDINRPKLEELISLEDGADLSALTADHLRRLVRWDDLWGKKIGRNSVTTKQAVKEYLARDRVNAEKEVPPAKDEDRGEAALTELFQQSRNADTPIVVERIVDDIDDIIRKIRFDGWQATEAGKREVRKALRRTLAKYKLHKDEELFEKAYRYVKEYY